MAKLYAFWPYDLYPRCLSDEVVKVEDTAYTMKSYGRFRRSERMVLVPANVGKKLAAELDKLTAERSKRIEEIEAEFERKLDEAFKAAGVARPGR